LEIDADMQVTDKKKQLDNLIMSSETDENDHRLLPSKLRKNTKLTDQQLNELIILVNCGELERAEKLALDITSNYPKNGIGWKVLGTIQQMNGDNDKAIATLKKALTILPRDAEVAYNLGNAYFDKEQSKSALIFYKKAISISPNFSKAYYNLGGLYRALNRLDLAEVQYKKVIKLDQENVDAYLKLASIYSEKQNSDECIKLLKHVANRNPDNADILTSLAIESQNIQNPNEAERFFNQAIGLHPTNSTQLYINYASCLKVHGKYEMAEMVLYEALSYEETSEIYNTLGLVYLELNKFEDCEYCFKKAMVLEPENENGYINYSLLLLNQGKLLDAEAYARHITQKFEANVAALNNHAMALYLMGDSEQSIIQFEKALKIEPNNVLVLSNLTNPLKKLGRLSEAESYLKKGLTIKPKDHDSHLNLAIIYMSRGLIKQAIETNLAAINIDPIKIIPYQNLLFATCYSSEYSLEFIMENLRRYGQVLTSLAKFQFSTWHHRQMTDKLRIGFVSADFIDHPVTTFLKAILEQFDLTRFELIAYSNNPKEDHLTQKLKPFFENWKTIVGIPDLEVANLIHADKVDVLIDLAGHSAGNRLGVFAYKPAPKQLTWLGYWASTGVEQMDYILLDKNSAPTEISEQFTEEIIYLPESRFCYSPPIYDVAVKALPAIANQYITFGCYHNYSKVNDNVLALWAKVMNAVPTSKLRWQTASFNDQKIVKEIESRFRRFGIKAERLKLVGNSSKEAYLNTFNEIDFCLDSFPFTSCTTASDALWMGVPTLTISGDRLVARQCTSLMCAVGLPEWVAIDEGTFISKAVMFANKVNQLMSVRARLRQQLLDSPLGDAKKFARNLENVLLDISSDGLDKGVSDLSDHNKSVSNSLAIKFVSATRLNKADFWEISALGQSLTNLFAFEKNLNAVIYYENTRGLSDIYNEMILAADENEILVFVHDDLWIDQNQISQSIKDGLDRYDVIGVAGNKRLLPNQPAWSFVNTDFKWDDFINLSGKVAHGQEAHGKLSYYGPVPAECKLLDGVFLAAKKKTLNEYGVFFDPQFDFHFYDLDFCRTSTNSGLSIGTWNIAITHQSTGGYGTKNWFTSYDKYLNKWENKNVGVVINQHQKIQEIYQTAFSFQQQGNDDEAEKLYLDIILLEPDHPEANHNLGFIEYNKTSAHEALPRFEKAVLAKPESEQFWVSYIDALIQTGKTESAIDAVALGQQYGLSIEYAEQITSEINTILLKTNQFNPIDYLAKNRAYLNQHLNRESTFTNHNGFIEAHGDVDTVILSICIPTFNRGNQLKKSLESIISQKIFLETNQVEIVIADNASTDETQEVSEAFVANFPGKVKYIRNSMNIGAGYNFEMVLSHGTGQYLKLLNDNLLVRDGALIEMLDMIRSTSNVKPVIFLTNGNNPVEGEGIIANNLNEFVQHVSFFSTWIAGFGIWRDEFHQINDFSLNEHLLLIQTDILLRMLHSGKKALVITEQYFDNLDVGKKGGYNIAEVFGKNYLSLLKSYCSLGSLSTEVYESEKKTVLIKHIIPYYFSDYHQFNKTGFFEHLQDYLQDGYFYEAIEELINNTSTHKIQQTPAQSLAIAWRNLNPHNDTQFEGVADLSRVKVGRKSYGKLIVWGYAHPDEGLTIGDFVSIADDVTFLLGGNHPYTGFSTFPYKFKYFATYEATTKGAITVGDDVWIGIKSMILSGVTVGQGAIIAAGSVVTRDVAPYSIVGGNPAKFIKYRFDEVIVEKLKSFDFSKLTDEKILENKEVLYETLTVDNVDSILSRLQ
jgi:protein O-GlcNAc transferase